MNNQVMDRTYDAIIDQSFNTQIYMIMRISSSLGLTSIKKYMITYDKHFQTNTTL